MHTQSTVLEPRFRIEVCPRGEILPKYRIQHRKCKTAQTTDTQLNIPPKLSGHPSNQRQTPCASDSTMTPFLLAQYLLIPSRMRFSILFEDRRSCLLLRPPPPP
ncbi:hypothetical protein VTJ04DRAFT_1348 [Mycothermus thermophilus]|uniref:uncharacterized protein n=1 Tax=Humicola insolens TaxID=85995 RepID=UPI0037446AD4